MPKSTPQSSAWNRINPGPTPAVSSPTTKKEIARPWAQLEPQTPQQLLEPEYQDVFHNYSKTKSPEHAADLLTSVDPIINEALRSYAGTESVTPTMKAKAKSLTLDAVDRYDPTRAKLRTHLLSHLRGLRRASERAIGGIYIPEQWRLDARVTAAARADMRDELGREPSVAEVADRTGIPTARVRRAVAAPGLLAAGQVGDVVGVSRPSEAAWNTWVDSIYHDSSPVDQVILDHSFGLHGRPVLPAHQIAKMVNLSPGAISQHKAKLQRDLDEYNRALDIDVVT